MAYMNNNTMKKSTNTKIKTMYCDISSLQLTYWDENMSIKINPLASVNQDGTRVYDYNRRGNSALSGEKAIAFADRIKKTLIPAIEKVKETGKLEKKVMIASLVGNKGTIVAVEYKEDDKGVPACYLTLYMNVGADGKAPKDGIFSYKFNKTTLIEDYDPELGTGNEVIVEAEFLFFYDKIRKIADICGTAAHSVNFDTTQKSTYSNNGNFQNNNATQQQNGYVAPSNYNAPVLPFDTEGFPFA